MATDLSGVWREREEAEARQFVRKLTADRDHAAAATVIPEGDAETAPAPDADAPGPMHPVQPSQAAQEPREAAPAPAPAPEPATAPDEAPAETETAAEDEPRREMADPIRYGLLKAVENIFQTFGAETPEETYAELAGIAEPQGAAAETVSTIAQFTGPFLVAGGPVGMAGRGLAAGAAKVAPAAVAAVRGVAGAAPKTAAVGQAATQGMVTGAMVDATAFDPDEHSGLIGMATASNPELHALMQEWMLAPDPHAPEWERRAQMVLEGAMLGGTIGVGLKVAQYGYKALLQQVVQRQQGTRLGGSNPATQSQMREQADVAAAEAIEETKAAVEEVSLPQPAGAADTDPEAVPWRSGGFVPEHDVYVPGRDDLTGLAPGRPEYVGGSAEEGMSPPRTKAEPPKEEAPKEQGKGALERAAERVLAGTRTAAGRVRATVQRAMPKPAEPAPAPKKRRPGPAELVGEGPLPRGAEGDEGRYVERWEDLMPPGESWNLEGLGQKIEAVQKLGTRENVRSEQGLAARSEVETQIAVLRVLGRQVMPELDEAGQLAYAKAERKMVDGYAYFASGAHHADRGAGLVDATTDFLTEVNRLLPEGRTWDVYAGMMDRDVVVEAVKGLRAQSVSPYFNPARADALDDVATRRITSPQEVRAQKPWSIGPTREDAWAGAQHTASLEPVGLPAEVAARAGGVYDATAARTDPIDVWMPKIQTAEDFDLLEATVTRERGIKRPSQGQDPRIVEAQAELTEARKALREEQRKGLPKIKPGQELRYYRAEQAERLAELKQARLRREEAGKALDAARDAVRNDERPVQRWWDAGQKAAEGALYDLTGLRGFGFLTGRHTGARWGVTGKDQGLDASLPDLVASLHSVDAVSSTLQRMATAASAPGATAAMRAQAVQAMHKTAAYMFHLYGRKGDVQRYLARSQLPMGEAASVAQRVKGKELIETSGGASHVDAVLAAVAASGDTRGVLRVLGQWSNGIDAGAFERAGHKAGFRQRQAAAFTFASNLLTKPATWLRNTGGSLAFGALRGGAERFLARVYEHGPVKGTSMAAKEIGAGATAAWSGLMEGTRLASTLARRDMGLMTQDQAQRTIDESQWTAMVRDMESNNRIDMDDNVSYVGLPKVVKERAAGTVWAGPVNMVSRALGGAASLGAKATMYTDVVARTVGYRSHLHARVAREGWGKGWSKKEADDRMEELLRDPEAHREAMASAEINAFMNRAGDWPTEAVLELKAKHPEIGFVMPYVNSLSNIAREGLRRTPGIGIAVDRWQLRQQGKRLTPQERAETMARQTTGLAIMGMGGALAYNGVMTGGNAGYPEETRSKLKAGWRPYSIVREREDGGKAYHTRIADLAGPAAPLLMLGASTAEMFASVETEAQMAEGMQLLSAATTLLADPYLSTHWGAQLGGTLEGITALMNGDEAKVEGMLTRGVVDVATSTLVPASSLVKSIEEMRIGGRADTGQAAGTPADADANEAVEALQEIALRMQQLTLANLGIGEGAYPKVDPFTGANASSMHPSAQARGEAGYGHVATNLISPLGISHGPVPNTLRDEALRIGYNPHFFPRKVPVQVPGDSDRQLFYEPPAEMRHEMARRAGKKFAQWGRRSIGTKAYDHLSVADQRTRMAAGWSQAKREAVIEVEAMAKWKAYAADIRSRLEREGIEEADASRQRNIERFGG